MKLRNKDTGEDGRLMMCHDYDEFPFFIEIGSIKIYYHNFADMVEAGWDCAKIPAEPLIKDERVRKAVRAWLAVQGQPIVAVAITRNKDSDGFFNYCLYGYIERARLSNGKPVVNKNLTAIDFEFRSLEKYEFERHRDYTIAELCGEEEE